MCIRDRYMGQDFQSLESTKLIKKAEERRRSVFSIIMIKASLIALLIIGAFTVKQELNQDIVLMDGSDDLDLNPNEFVMAEAEGDEDPSFYMAQMPFFAATEQRAIKWKCIDETGMSTAIAFDPVNKDIVCFGDGNNCHWGLNTKEACQAAVAQAAAGGKFLRCGDQHKSVWGSTGYENDGHWCMRGLRMYVRCIDDTGIRTAVWQDPATGDITCIGDGTGNSCNWKLEKQDACYAALKQYSGTKTYLTCGSDILAKQGTDGYSYPNHYCRYSRALFKAGKWEQATSLQSQFS
eukprot:TRINITY_DN2422_c0_g2_i2.p1 TRINITY_DN2422_c0_g2~~TRINITY_DN2422_c0_g2_i2.p1  ORF type:complete len:293 (+),score=86.65 TRINITY_DN2422_c0_g2_i2:80-958(+)